MASIEHALSIMAPGMEHPGLFTGRMAVNRRGQLTLETVTNAQHESAAFAEALRFEDETIANAVADAFVKFMPPGTSITRVEFVRAGQ